MTDLYDVGAIYHHGNSLIFRAIPKKDPVHAFQVLRKRLKSIGFKASSREDMQGYLIRVAELPWQRRIPPAKEVQPSLCDNQNCSIDNFP